MIDSLSPISAIQDANPYPWYALLTEDEPFYFDDALQCWVASNAEAVNLILNNPDMKVRPITEPIPNGLVGTSAGEIFEQLVRMRDDDLQLQLKTNIIQAFSNINTEEVRALARELTEKLLFQGIGINKILFLIPSGVIATLCGFMPKSINEIVPLISEFVLCIPATASRTHQYRASIAAKKLHSLFSDGIKQAPHGSLLTSLIKATNDGVDHITLIANSIGFLSQTYDATAGLIGNTIISIGRYMDEYSQDLLSDFVKEVSRFDSPIQNTRRFASKSFTYQGHSVKPGQSILLLLAAANRDPLTTHDPHAFKLQRSKEQNFTFSAGRHLCPGKDFALAITCGVVEILLQYQPSLAISNSYKIQYMNSGNARIPTFLF